MLAGSRCLSIFTSALNARVLRAHAAGPLRPRELEEVFGWAPQSSLRVVVRKMCEIGALTRVGPDDPTPGAATELTAAGSELLPVADALEAWLANAPGGPIPPEDAAAYGTIRILTAAWDSTVVRALAERPYTLVELSSAISGTNYPALKRRLAKLRWTNLVTPVRTGNVSSYVANDWLRQAAMPLILAGRWEHRFDAGAQPISQVEIEAAFLLTLPLVDFPTRPSGACALAVLTSNENSRKRAVAGVTVEVKQGELISCGTGTPAIQDTWALGTVAAWLDAVIDGRRDLLRFRGTKPQLAENIVKALHAGLFQSPRDATRPRAGLS